MAKTRARRSRNNKNFVAIPFTKELALSTLANSGVLSVAVTPGLAEDLYVMSTDISASIRGLTAGEGDPMSCGLVHGAYDNTQIQENLQVSITGPGDKIEQEQARRLVRRSGILQAQGPTGNQTILNMIGRNGSRVIRTRIGFVIQNPRTLSAWIMNRSGANLTTGASVTFDGTVYGRWIL